MNSPPKDSLRLSTRKLLSIRSTSATTGQFLISRSCLSYSSAVYEQIIGHFDSHHLLPETQSAYGKNRSTKTATIKVMFDAYQAADAGLLTSLGRLDLSAAFDSLTWLTTRSFSIGADIQPAESVRDLGVLIDIAMTLTTHVNHLVGVSFFDLRQIRIIHLSLSTNAAALQPTYWFALLFTRVSIIATVCWPSARST